MHRPRWTFSRWEPRSFSIAARLAGAVPLGYAFISVLATLLGAIVSAMGVAKADAVVLCGMTGFVMYLVWLIWAFSARSVALVYIVALVAGSVSAGLIWLLHMLAG